MSSRGSFYCRAGIQVDGHKFIPEAVSAGAIAVVAQKYTPGLSVPNHCRQHREAGKISGRILRAPFPGAEGNRNNRHKRQDHLLSCWTRYSRPQHRTIIGTLYNKVRALHCRQPTPPRTAFCQRLLRDMVAAGVPMFPWSILSRHGHEPGDCTISL